MNEKCTLSKLANQNKRFCKLENYTVEFPFPNFLRTLHAIILRIVAKKLECASKLYLPSKILNHGLKNGLFLSLFQCDELASCTSKDLNSCPSTLLQNLDKQINSFQFQTTFCYQLNFKIPKEYQKDSEKNPKKSKKITKNLKISNSLHRI